jgi:hypothetical protein
MSVALRSNASSPSTPHQRPYIRTLMDRVEIDSLFATLFHRRFFEAANLPAPTPGAKLDPTLEALTRAQGVRPDRRVAQGGGR